MKDLTGHVEASIRERALVRDGQRVAVAVSGGVDSMVLLAVLAELREKHRWALTVAHFNHRLRGRASDADERLVRATARRLKLPFVSARGDVKAFAKKSGLSIEMAARQLRHEFLAATARAAKIPTIALAHHADDQVELFFLRLLRGAGSEGLAGMKWSNPSPFSPKIGRIHPIRLIRPILDIPKADLQAFAKARAIRFSEDATNSSLDFQRNRIRHELLPLLTNHYQPALARTILRVMEVAGAESDFLQETAKDWLQSAPKPKFASLPVALQRRVIRAQLADLNVFGDFDLIERLRLHPGQKVTIEPGWAVVCDASGAVQTVASERVEFSAEKQSFLLSRKEKEMNFGGLRVLYKIADDNGTPHAGNAGRVEYFDADKVGTEICLRLWQPGDRFQPIGMPGSSKLQDLFTNLKVAPEERRRRVVAIAQNGELFWVEGLRMSEKFKLDKNTVHRLKWSWQRAAGRTGLRIAHPNDSVTRGSD